MSKKKKELRGSSEFPMAIVWWLLLLGLFVLMSWDIDAWLDIPVDHPTDFERSFMEK